MSTTTTSSPSTETSQLALGDWGYFLMTISWLFVVISFIFCVYATYAGYNDYNKRKRAGTDPNTLSTQKYAMILTIVCMWSFTAISISDAIGFPHWFMNKDAQYEDWDEWWFNWEHSSRSYIMWNVFWAIAKVNLYIVYLYRIYTITKQTKYVTKPILYYITLFLIFGQFICLVLWVYYYNISWYCCEIWADNQYEILTIIAWVILILDAIISIFLVYLYIVCMKNLFQSLPADALQMENVNVSGITGNNTKQSDGNEEETQEMAQSGNDDVDNERNVVVSGDDDGWESKEHELVKTATRLFVVAMVSFISSIFYQLLFGIAITEEFYGSHGHTALYYFTFTWNVDSTLNVICLYLSLPIGKKMYYSLCKCDGCCFRCIQNMTKAN